MKRRFFLGATALGGTALATTDIKKFNILEHDDKYNPNWIPSTALELDKKLSEMFYCVDGEPRSFMELKREDAEKFMTPNAFNHINKIGDHDIYRFTYTTFAYAVESDDVVKAEAQLAERFYNEFYELQNATNDKKMLLWRTRPQFSSERLIEWGDTYLTREESEDKKNDYFDIPDNVYYDFDTGEYKYINRKYTLNKIRMRLNMPEVDFDSNISLTAKKEGHAPIIIKV